MQIGQKLGPFVIDKELGAGAMGAVYRGVYTKTGQRVAIKVMAPGLGKESAAARFEREAAILKQFNHPNIVRLFGTGRYHGTAYYAMEYIEGESLDRVLNRRGKLTWEEVVDYGMQLAAALQHAHESGVIHRDLKPSNLMVLKDGRTLKLTDFGIAKDTDVTALTSANCTVGTAAYMSPEQCKGDRDLTSKSDLYSLGVVFFELLCGKKPLDAENAMELFIKHVNEVPGRVSHQPGCMEVPPLLDTLISQLMEKKPEHRPMNAAMVYAVLEQVRNKAESQQSAGVDAAKKKLLDTPRDQRNVDDTDKEAARLLLGGKTRMKKKRKKGHFFRSILFQVAAILALLGGTGTAIWLAVKPPGPEKLYAQARKMWDSNKPDEWDKAIAEHGPITVYLKNYGDRPECAELRNWQNQIEQAQCESLLDRYVARRRDNKAMQVQSNNDAEEAAFKAAWAEEEGDLDKAGKTWEKMKSDFPSGSGFPRWGRLAEKHLALIEGAKRLDEKLAALDKTKSSDELKLKDFEKESHDAIRDAEKATKRLSTLKEKWEEAIKSAPPGKADNERIWLLWTTAKLRALQEKK